MLIIAIITIKCLRIKLVEGSVHLDKPPRYLLHRLHSRHTKNFPLGKGTVFSLQEGSNSLTNTGRVVCNWQCDPPLTNTYTEREIIAEQ